MNNYRSTPPPLLHSESLSDSSSSFSREVTPITLVTKESRKQEQGSWFQKPLSAGGPTTSSRDIGIDDDVNFPLFGESGVYSRMATNGFASRQTSTSPRGNQPSALTASLGNINDNTVSTMPMITMDPPRPSLASMESSDMSRFENGARPIATKSRPIDKRRESLAQSLGMGMSWGGASVGSWIRDDMLMTGTSPFAFHNSPSYHSSSYLPKMEANFMKDFVCCGMTLPTLHDLLQHYEEAHAQKEPVANDGASQPVMPDQRAAIATNTAAQIQHEAQRRAQNEQMLGGAVQASRANMPSFNTNLQTVPDMDTVDDMDMDDIDQTTPPANNYITPKQTSPNHQYARTVQSQMPQINTNLMQGHQGYRNSTPSTPVAGRNPALQGSNMLSTLNTNPMQQFHDLQSGYRGTPDSSAPGTPGALDDNLLASMDDFNLQSSNLYNNGFNAFGNNLAFGMSNDMIDLCIDEPAKRLFQTNNNGNTVHGNSQQAIHQRLGSGQYGANSDIARRIREQQIAAGLADTVNNLAPNEEPKPFRCPVIGCEKSYKNNNGLKYHKVHGHQSQRLQDNNDGTFSILNDNNQPYEGTAGMVAQKPYACDHCQKRYKNLNGLKYHLSHSNCGPDVGDQRLKEQAAQSQQHNQTQSTTKLETPLSANITPISTNILLPHQSIELNNAFRDGDQMMS